MSGGMVEAIERAKASGEFHRLVEVIPYAQFVGISVEVEDGALVATLAERNTNIGNAALPALHGGTIGALLESVAIFEVIYRSETVRLPKTITLTIDYLRSGKPVDTFARAEVTRHGRRVANVSSIAWQESPGSPIATASVHLLLAQ
jgi:uncharacterized protein (TIGR00369 family)